MNNIPFLHFKKDKQDLINSYYIALIPLILFGLYKNGLHLYLNELINFSSILIPIYFYVISIIVGIILSLVLKENKKENILICLIMASTISLNTNMLIYPILLFVSLFIGKYFLSKIKISINLSSFTRVLLILSLLINSYSYLNIAEKLNKFNYNSFDIMLGYGIGGIATTSFIILIFSLVILSLNRFYKKVIPIVSSLTFIIINFLFMLIIKDFSNFNILLNGSVYFGFVFIAADITSSPNNRKGMILYAIIIGILTSIVNILGFPYEASYISTLLVSFFIPLINKVINKNYYLK